MPGYHRFRIPFYKFLENFPAGNLNSRHVSNFDVRTAAAA